MAAAPAKAAMAIAALVLAVVAAYASSTVFEARLEEVRRFPERCWVFKSEAARKYGLTMRQLERAMAEGLVRFYEVEKYRGRRRVAYRLFVIFNAQ